MDFARGGTLEGLGGPIRMDEVRHDGIDPTLDSCCQREVRPKIYESVPCIVGWDDGCFLCWSQVDP